MLLGYNQPRPARENYLDFMRKLEKGINRADIAGLSLMIYGSFVRGEMDFGRSDIDGILIFDDDVVIDKEKLAVCSTIVAEALAQNHIPFQVTVTDKRTMRDGRFNAYNSTFENYFKEEKVLLFGPDYRPEFNFEMPFHPEQGPLTFNLRKTRQGLLFAEYEQQYDYEQFLKRFGKSLDAVSRGSKQVLYMIDGTFTKNRFSALQRINAEFPRLDVEPLAEIKKLYQHPKKLDALYRRPTEVVRVWNDSLTFLEEMIKGYLDKNPRDKQNDQSNEV